MIQVLAVDDEAPIRQWLAYCINRMEGFACTPAATAAEGLAIFRQEQPEIVLSDIEMPGGDGLSMLAEIHRQSPDTCLLVLTSHSDFRYARSALQLGTAEYLLKAELTEAALHETLQKAVVALRRLQNSRVVTGLSRAHYLQGIALQKTPGVLTLDDLAQQGIHLQNAPVAVLDCCDTAALTPEQLAAAAGAVLAAGGEVYHFAVEAGHTLLFFNLPDPGGEPLAAGAARLWRSLCGAAPGLTLGVADVLPSPTALRAGLDSARARSQMRFYDPATPVIATGSPGGPTGQEEAVQLAYMRALLRQDFAAAYHTLTDYLAEIAARRPADTDGVRRVLGAAGSSFLHFAQDASADVDAAAAAARARMLAAASLPALQAEVDTLFLPVLTTTEQTEGLTTPIRQAIAYMEQHYPEKITLGEIARTAAFSPEHFSRLFSRETGITFVTYLNNLRMKQAITLLETTTLKVYEIAEQVGFSSLSYFSTAFKKKFGQNPYEYQINYQRTGAHTGDFTFRTRMGDSC